MLIETLREIDNMDVYSKALLAKKLDTSEAVIDHVLVQLKRMGYIMMEDNIKQSECTSCKGCCHACHKNNLDNNIILIEITDKGKNILEN